MKATIVEHARAGAAVILSSHLLHLVEEICTRVLIMRRGRVLAFGTIAEIVAARPGSRGAASLEDVFLGIVGEDGGEDGVTSPLWYLAGAVDPQPARPPAAPPAHPALRPGAGPRDWPTSGPWDLAAAVLDARGCQSATTLELLGRGRRARSWCSGPGSSAPIAGRSPSPGPRSPFSSPPRVTRRELIQYKLLRGQLVILFNASCGPFLLSGGLERLGPGARARASGSCSPRSRCTGSGVALLRSSLVEHGVARRRGRAITLALVVAGIAVVARWSVREALPALRPAWAPDPAEFLAARARRRLGRSSSALLLPARLLVRPLLRRSLGATGFARCSRRSALLASHYVWVVRSDAAFEESAAAAALSRAARAGRPPARRGSRPRRVPPLAPDRLAGAARCSGRTWPPWCAPVGPGATVIGFAVGDRGGRRLSASPGAAPACWRSWDGWRRCGPASCCSSARSGCATIFGATCHGWRCCGATRCGPHGRGGRDRRVHRGAHGAAAGSCSASRTWPFWGSDGSTTRRPAAPHRRPGGRRGGAARPSTSWRC